MARPMMETLKNAREFDRVYRYGRKFWNHAFVVYMLPARKPALSNVERAETAETPPSRYGITASRKVGNSVQRNRAKRLIRESLRLMGERIRPGFDIVVVVRPAAHTLKCPQAQSLLENLLERGRVFVEYPSRRPSLPPQEKLPTLPESG